MTNTAIYNPLVKHKALMSEIFREFSHPDIHRIDIVPELGRVDVEVDILRDQYDSNLIKWFAEKDLRLSHKYPDVRIHFEYRFIISEGVTTTSAD